MSQSRCRRRRRDRRYRRGRGLSAAGAAWGRRDKHQVSGVIHGVYAVAAIAAATQKNGVAAGAAEGAVAAEGPQEPAVATPAVRRCSPGRFRGQRGRALSANHPDRCRRAAGADAEGRPISAVGAGASSPTTSPQPARVDEQSSGASGNIDSVDASCTSAVVGAGAPGGTASDAGPAIAAPVIPVVTSWRADIRGAVLRCLDTIRTP